MEVHFDTVDSAAAKLAVYQRDERRGALLTGDIETMAGYAVNILQDEKRLRVMGETARFEAHTRFCASEIIPRYEDYYRRILERVG